MTPGVPRRRVFCRCRCRREEILPEFVASSVSTMSGIDRRPDRRAGLARLIRKRHGACHDYRCDDIDGHHVDHDDGIVLIIDVLDVEPFFAGLYVAARQ
jgi:hypothetical protein